SKLTEIRVSLRAHGERILSCLGHSCPTPKDSRNPIRNISAETCNLISDMSSEVTSDEVSFGCIRDIRGIRSVFQKFPNFPRKGSKNFTQYSYERPEITPHDEESTKAKTRKEKLNHE